MAPQASLPIRSSANGFMEFNRSKFFKTERRPVTSSSATSRDVNEEFSLKLNRDIYSRNLDVSDESDSDRDTFRLEQIKNDHLKELKIVPECTFFIVDWDDTLLATSWLARRSLTLDTAFIPEREAEELEILDATVCSFLRKVMYLYGTVNIVTNAQKGWIELSAKKFLPETYDLMFQPAGGSTCSYSSSSSGFHYDESLLTSSSSNQPNTMNFSADFIPTGSTGITGAKRRLPLPLPIDPDIHEQIGLLESQRDEMDVDVAESVEFPQKKRYKRSRSHPHSGGRFGSSNGTSKKSHRIGVISARHFFERENPWKPSEWKRACFKKVLQEIVPPEFHAPDDDTKSEPDPGSVSITPCSSSATGWDHPKSSDEPILPSEEHAAVHMDELERRNDALASSFTASPDSTSIDDFDLSGLIEIEGESFEVETDFEESDSFFSFDFKVRDEDSDHFEEESVEETSARPEPMGEEQIACNLISIGDCFHDCESLRTVELEFKRCFKKTVQLIEYPEISQLVRQLRELEIHLDSIVKAKRDVDLSVEAAFLK